MDSWVYIMTIGYILCSFDTFFRFWYHVPTKIWQPWLEEEVSYFGGLGKNGSVAFMSQCLGTNI
jgi:hypothetical protein